jgi:hypothetical protein
VFPNTLTEKLLIRTNEVKNWNPERLSDELTNRGVLRQVAGRITSGEMLVDLFVIFYVKIII